MIRILLAEDNEIVRNGLVRLLSSEQDLELVGVGADGTKALQLLAEGVQPDIILTDWNMPSMNGTAFIRKVKKHYPAIALIVLTMHDKAIFREKALKAGANAFLLKGDTGELLATIRMTGSNNTGLRIV
jgi:DNA-binding NarL/FixJ family response regulator